MGLTTTRPRRTARRSDGLGLQAGTPTSKLRRHFLCPFLCAILQRAAVYTLRWLGHAQSGLRAPRNVNASRQHWCADGIHRVYWFRPLLVLVQFFLCTVTAVMVKRSAQQQSFAQDQRLSFKLAVLQLPCTTVVSLLYSYHNISLLLYPRPSTEQVVWHCMLKLRQQSSPT